MFLSVILPIYNVEKYLYDCLNSVLKQTFTDYEIILVDDGSKDLCPQICDDFAKKHKNTKVIHKANGGLSSARNAGFKIASGDYIYYLDSDDYLLNDDFFYKLFEAAKTKPDFIVFKHIRFFENQNKFSECLYNYDISKNSFSSIVKELVRKDAFFGMAWIKVVKKELLLKYNLTFIEGLLGEDMPWNFDLYLNSKSIFLMDSVEYVYRQRDNSITTTTKIKNLTDFIKIIDDKYTIIQSAKCDQELKTALLGALSKYYSNLLITYVRVKDKNKKQFFKKIKELSPLLKFALSNRPLKIKKIYRIFGLKITLFILALIDRKNK